MVIVRCIFIVIVIGVLIFTIKYSIFVTTAIRVFSLICIYSHEQRISFLDVKEEKLFLIFSMFLEIYFHILGNIFPDVRQEK